MCLKTNRYFADADSLKNCEKEHNNCSECPFKPLEIKVTPQEKKESTNPPVVIWPEPDKKETPNPPIVIWPELPQESTKKKGMFSRIFSKDKPENTHGK